MTVRQASQMLEVSQSTIYALIGAGKLGCSRHGLGRGCIRISEQQMAEYRASAEEAAEMKPPAVPPARKAFRHVRIPGA